MSLIEASATELAALLTAGDVTAREVTTAFCDRIETVEPHVQAFLHHDRDAALAQAEAIDQRRRAGEPIGKLAGLPVAVKDIVCAKGEPTTCGSRMLANFVPPYDAHVVARLRAEDAVLIGRTNLDEFAMGGSTENSSFHATHNPWNAEHVPGGSSGGSAACVAAREAPLAIASDTGGSIRQPAAFCGVVGLKPTYGRVSRFGLVAFASSLDQLGPIAGSVEDAALLLEVIAGHDPRDSTCVDRPTPNYRETIDKPVERLRVGYVAEHIGQGLDPEVHSAVRSALAVFEAQGAEIAELSLPHSEYAVATYYLIATAEASSNLARYDGVHYGMRAEQFGGMIDMYATTRGEGFGAEVKRRIMLGTFALSTGYRDAYYLKALRVRRLIKNDFDQAFGRVDVIVGPTTPTPAFRVGEKVDDPLEMYLTDIYTVGANLAGLPSISVPCGFDKQELPIGLQIQAAPFGEETLLRAARMYQRETDWHSKRASIGTESGNAKQ